MLKPLLIASSLSVFALANAPMASVSHIDVKNSVQKLIDTTITKHKTEGGWAIVDRKKGNNSETFSSIYTQRKKAIAHDPMNDILGLSFSHALKYSKDTFHAVSLLTAFPSNMQLNKAQKIITEKVIKDKLIEVTSDYNVVNYKYTASFKDINTTVPQASLTTKGIAITGLYNANDLLNQSSLLTLNSLEVKPTAKRLAGEFIRIKDISIASDSKAKDTKLTANYHIALKSLDALMMKKVSIIDNLDFKMTIGNVDALAYESITKQLQANPKLDLNDKKTLSTLIHLVTAQGVYIELNNLSVDKLKLKDMDMGTGKISAKISLNSTPELAKMIAMSPLMALSALEVQAHIELSPAMYKAIMMDKRAMMLQMLTPKKVNGNKVYDISFKQGKLLINGKPFGPPSH